MTVQRLSQRSRIHLLQAASIPLSAAILLTQPVLVGRTHEFLELIGMALIILCVAGRLWSILYIGSKKNRELVTTGPYSITRNPLYLFSTVGAIGIGLVIGSIAAALILGLLAYGILIATANKESKHLESIFGAEYIAYARRTPLFLPRPVLYRDSAEVAFSPQALKRTFMDGLVFLLAFPAIEAVEHLQGDGIIPILMRIL
jgi:protein-S-isoprenylcysteine O-methyltransferase Ste14